MSSRPAVRWIGHRGSPCEAPENTLSSFRAAWAAGCDGIELDMHLTADGRIVVLHDSDTARVTGVNRPVAEQTLAELQNQNAANYSPWRERGIIERLPTLEEALSLTPAGGWVYLEIKCGPEILPALGETLRNAPVSARRTAILSFRLEVAAEAKRRLPDHVVCWLREWNPDSGDRRFDPKEMLDRARRANLDGLNLEHRFPINRETIDRIHVAGLRCEVWTVDDTAIARPWIDAGVDSITSNRAGLLRRELTLS